MKDWLDIQREIHRKKSEAANCRRVAERTKFESERLSLVIRADQLEQEVRNLEAEGIK